MAQDYHHGVPVMLVRWRCVIVLQVPEPPPRLQGWQWVRQ